MTLVETLNIDFNKVKFYKGIDFDILCRHAKDGSEGFIVCFIDSWSKEVEIYNRNNKIKSVLLNKDFNKFEWENINNNFISVYQAENIDFDALYETIKRKYLNKQLPESLPWIPISGIDKGAWKIEVGKNGH